MKQPRRLEGTTPAKWLDAHLQGMIAPAEPAAPVDAHAVPKGAAARRLTLAERIAADPEPFYSGRGDLAARHSELFAEGMLEKRRTGTL